MSDFNRVILLGRIGNDLELKTSAKGKPYLRLSLATDYHIKEKDEKTTHWHQVVVFGQTAESCAQWLRKGSQIMVEGRLEVRTYTNDKEQKTTRVSVVADTVKFVGSRIKNSAPEAELNEDFVASA